MTFSRALALAALLGALSAAGAGSALAQGMVLFIEIGQSNPSPVRPEAPVDNIRDLTRALRGCWSPPPIDNAVGPVDVTFQVSFKRSGELFGKPKFVTFVQKVPTELRQRYHQAVAEALDLCQKMPFTDTMGGAVAGRPFRVNFLDRRNTRRTESTWPTTITR